MISNKRNCFFVVACLMLTANSAIARPWYVEPRVQVSAGYDDNPAMDTFFDSDADIPEGERIIYGSSPFAIIGGDIRLGSESESDLIAFDFEAIARRYSDVPVLDSERLLASALYEKYGINNDYGLVAGFASDSSLETLLIDTGRFNENVARNTFFIRPTLTTRFSPMWVGDFELGYRDVTYDESEEEEMIGPDYIDFEDFGGSARLNRIISERLNIFGLAEFLHYRPTELTFIGLERDNFAAIQLGIDYQISEKLGFYVSGGPGRTNSDVFEIEETIKFTGPVYSAGIDYSGERNTVAASFVKTFRSSGDGSLALAQTYSIAWIRSDTFGGTLTIPVSYLKREPKRAEELGLDVLAYDLYELAPAIEWQINPDFSISAEIRYREQKRRTVLSNITSHGDSTAIIIGASYYFGQKRISY